MIAQEIKALRAKTGPTKVQLADQLGCSPLTVSAWERTKARKEPIPVFREKLERLAKER